MGTRSNTLVYDEYHGNGSSVQILNLYRQHDGYVEGHGAELLKFLEPMTIVNGITTGLTNIANGSGCENDFTYKIYVSGGPQYITMEVWEYEDLIFSGNVSEFKEFVERKL